MNDPNFIIVNDKLILNQLEDILIEINSPLFSTPVEKIGEHFSKMEKSIVDLSAISKLEAEDFTTIFKLIGSIQNIQSFRNAFNWNVEERDSQIVFRVNGPSEFGSICYTLPFLIEFFNHKKAFKDILNIGIKKNEFGQLDKTGWNKKFVEFFCDFLLPSYSSKKKILSKAIYNPKFQESEWTIFSFDREIYTVVQIYNHVSDLYIHLTEQYFSFKESPKASSNQEKGLTMEQDCMEILKKNSWEVRTTPQSNDQGADLIAERGMLKLIIQCKNYKSAVGNDSVQQALAAKSFYGGTVAAVVSKSGFTSSATQLAEKTDVMLLTIKDLAEI